MLYLRVHTQCARHAKAGEADDACALIKKVFSLSIEFYGLTVDGLWKVHNLFL